MARPRTQIDVRDIRMEEQKLTLSCEVELLIAPGKDPEPMITNLQGEIAQLLGNRLTTTPGIMPVRTPSFEMQLIGKERA